MLSLDRRLSLIASFVESNSRVCDVGCDHGFLSAYLYRRGDIVSVCATDINEKPLLNAQKTFEKLGIDGIPLYLCDGLEKIDKTIADTVIIAGMGGEVISVIIDRAPFLRDTGVSIILQPMTSVSNLRRYLAQNGFDVIKESAVSEKGKVYSVMLVRFGGQPHELSPLKERIGEIKNNSQDDLLYIERQINLLREYIENIKKVPQKENELKTAESTLNKLKELAHIGI